MALRYFSLVFCSDYYVCAVGVGNDTYLIIYVRQIIYERYEQQGSEYAALWDSDIDTVACFRMATNCDLLFKYDLNQSCTLPRML